NDRAKECQSHGSRFTPEQDAGGDGSPFTRVAGELVSISSGLLARGGDHPGQVASPSRGNRGTQDKQPCTHSFIPRGKFRETNKPNSHLFGLLEEAGVPGENPHMQGENVQIPYRKTPALLIIIIRLYYYMMPEKKPFLSDITNIYMEFPKLC
ncbi:hypothetical protein XENORESO_016978, partial [Xenotaenia resolanae]